MQIVIILDEMVEFDIENDDDDELDEAELDEVEVVELFSHIQIDVQLIEIIDEIDDYDNEHIVVVADIQQVDYFDDEVDDDDFMIEIDEMVEILVRVNFCETQESM